MKRIKEKLKCIWHIIKDKEYAIFTGTSKDKRASSACAIISDNASLPFIRSVSETMFKVEGKLPNNDRYYFITYRTFKRGDIVASGHIAIVCDGERMKTKQFLNLVLKIYNNSNKRDDDALQIDFIKEISAQQYFNGIF